MSKSKHKTLVAKTTHEMRMADHRNALIQTGMYGHYKEKSHGSKKSYNRNEVKRKAYFED